MSIREVLWIYLMYVLSYTLLGYRVSPGYTMCRDNMSPCLTCSLHSVAVLTSWVTLLGLGISLGCTLSTVYVCAVHTV